jgi:superfamily II RNA helicase
VEFYLRSAGWKKVAERPNHSSSWLYKDADGDEFEIALPLNDAFRDYAQRMSDLLQTLEAQEQRSQLEIFNDLFERSFQSLAGAPEASRSTIEEA